LAGLYPATQRCQVTPPVRSHSEATSRYGAICNGKWADEAKWMEVLPIPLEIAKSWINLAMGGPTVKVYCNRDLAGPLLRALEAIKSRGHLPELHTFDGCFQIRDIRGCPGAQSAHSFGLAIDVNAATNRLGYPPSLSPGFVSCFTEQGFTWGGNFHRRDGMHMQFCSGF
jgi:D-alanyl-D-alanine carboxypeptidase